MTTAQWTNEPCHYFWSNDGDELCGACGWKKTEHGQFRPKRNGESVTKSEDLSIESKLDVLLEAVTQLTEKVQELTDSQAEIVEKIANMSLSGTDYDLEYEDS